MMNSSSIFARRMAPKMMRQQPPLSFATFSLRQSAAAFSTDCAPAEKLRTVLEEYRQSNFSDEIPSRFRKHIIKEIVEEPGYETFQVDNLNRVLANIGREDARLSHEELNALLQSAGSEDRRIPISQMMQLM